MGRKQERKRINFLFHFALSVIFLHLSYYFLIVFLKFCVIVEGVWFIRRGPKNYEFGSET